MSSFLEPVLLEAARETAKSIMTGSMVVKRKGSNPTDNQGGRTANSTTIGTYPCDVMPYETEGAAAVASLQGDQPTGVNKVYIHTIYTADVKFDDRLEIGIDVYTAMSIKRGTIPDEFELEIIAIRVPA